MFCNCQSSSYRGPIPHKKNIVEFHQKSIGAMKSSLVVYDDVGYSCGFNNVSNPPFNTQEHHHHLALDKLSQGPIGIKLSPISCQKKPTK